MNVVSRNLMVITSCNYINSWNWSITLDIIEGIKNMLTSIYTVNNVVTMI